MTPNTLTSPSQQNRVEDLPLFIVPRIESPAPVAPGSESSRVAAKAIEPFRAKSHRRIMLALASAGRPLTREEICARTGMKESSACARISELRDTWITKHDGGGIAQSGHRVDTYSLTAQAQDKAREVAA